MTAHLRDIQSTPTLAVRLPSWKATPVPSPRMPRVVIVGAGFGGLAAATALKHPAVQVTIIDRRNYHLFQPLLYQVATAALSPADIAQPIRSILWRQCNATVLHVVSLNWLWAYLTFERGSRLITGPTP